MAKSILFVGAASGVGKSTIAAGVCRWLYRRGVRVAPFKALNLASQSAVLDDGTEIGAGQAVQAAACGVKPDPRMNPVLLKPAGRRTRCYLRGRETEGYGAYQYRERNVRFRADAAAAYRELAEEYEVIVMEGSGSCCELNLLAADVANLPMAAAVGAPAVLVGDIEAGGIFASLCGTLSLLPEEYRRLVRGMIVNKFHGDPSSFSEGVRILEDRSGLPVLGVLPYLRLELPEEDGPRASELHMGDLDTPACEAAFDRLADALAHSLDMRLLLQIIGL